MTADEPRPPLSAERESISHAEFSRFVQEAQEQRDRADRLTAELAACRIREAERVPMNDLDMSEAKAEAQRFLDRIADYNVHIHMEAAKHLQHDACSERAAIRRASLDLSRALSRLRNR